jgi:hypothetical protein
MLIGSRALAYWIQSVDVSDHKDWDIITNDPPETHLKVEIHSPDEYLSDQFLKFATDNFIVIGDKSYPICSLRGLSAIKLSHLSLDHNWMKHISGWHRFLKPHFNPEDWDLVKVREKITLEKAKQRHPKLNMSKDEFFDDSVKKIYNHDWLHERVAYHDEPLYKRLQYPHKANSAWCERELWDLLSHEDKLKCVAEETTVIALERFLIPGLDQYAYSAYNKALKKVCISLTSGWFRDFAIWNWPTLKEMVRKELIIELTKELKNG